MPIWKKPTDRTYLENTLNKNTLGETLGIEITEVGEEYLEGRMPVDHRTKQPFGLLHGGASVALAETLASVAGFLSLSMIPDVAIAALMTCTKMLLPHRTHI